VQNLHINAEHRAVSLHVSGPRGFIGLPGYTGATGASGATGENVEQQDVQVKHSAIFAAEHTSLMTFTSHFRHQSCPL